MITETFLLRQIKIYRTLRTTDSFSQSGRENIVFTQCTWYIILKARNLYGSGFLNGGGGGIRTHGTLVTYDGFQDRSDKPLWHSSIQFYQIFLILFVQNILSISYFIVKLF